MEQETMKYLHVIGFGNISINDCIAANIRNYFNVNEHKMILLGEGGHLACEAVIETRRISKMNIRGFLQFYSELKKADRIYLHSMCIGFTSQALLLLHPWIMKRVYWFGWGMDLYEFVDKSVGLRRIIGMAFRERIKEYVGIFEPDIDYYKEHISSSKDCLYVPYINIADEGRKILALESLRQRKFIKRTGESPVRIMIGHQGNPALHHIEVLEMLEKFKDDNMEIILPLAYGDRTNTMKIEEYAKDHYGEKAIIMNSFVPYDEYIEMLSTVDIAIFNTKRQIALGNLYPLIFLGTKLYIPSDGVMYHHFIKYGISVVNYEMITNMDFAAFSRSINGDKGYKFYLDTHDANEVLKDWSLLFN